MKKLLFLTIQIIAICNSLTGNQSINVSGKLLNKETGKVISSGVIYLNPGNKVSISNQYGEYKFTTTKGIKHITTNVLGYKTVVLNFSLISDTVLNIFLELSPIELKEVRVLTDSIKYIERTRVGNIIITPAAVYEIPRVFSEPDLMKTLQLLPGVVSGKEGTSDIFVRGGNSGQNIILANGCYFFLPSHLLGIISPYDFDFIESTEFYKDYFPSDIGGAASSVLNLDFRKVHSDSLKMQIRLGLISSGIILEKPFKKKKLDLTVGLRKSNYSLYAPLLKKLLSSDVGTFLPPDKYTFYDSFLKLSHISEKGDAFTYLFFGNYDNGKKEYSTTGQSGDTISKYREGVATGWNSMVHAFQWEPASKSTLKWKFDLNYNRLSLGRKIYSESESSVTGTSDITSGSTLYSFYPTINNFGVAVTINKKTEKYNITVGVSDRMRFFNTNNFADNNVNSVEIHNDLSSKDHFNESSLFITTFFQFPGRLKLDAGLRLNSLITTTGDFLNLEPRLRLSLNEERSFSPHITYVKLSQNDHPAEGSNAGLRTALWLPPSKEFGPEISESFSGGFSARIKNSLMLTADVYYKKIYNTIDFKPGASFVFDTTFVDLLDKINVHAYGLEVGVIKRSGKISGSISYTYSRSKREWNSPDGTIWIPSSADRPHNLDISLKYSFSNKTSFGMNFIYQSGAPATIYTHETSYGEFFETKNNIRFFDYHRLDLSIRHLVYKRKISIYVEGDIYNVYNRRNTFYFKKTYDDSTGIYYFKNISLFPIMPSLTVTIKI
jgi:hypothetical protein